MVSQFAWRLIVIDGTKVFCRILGVMHMTRKIASEEQDESMADIEPLPLKFKTFQEAIQSLENVQHFLESQGLLQQTMSIADAVDDVTGLKLASCPHTQHFMIYSCLFSITTKQ